MIEGEYKQHNEGLRFGIGIMLFFVVPTLIVELTEFTKWQVFGIWHFYALYYILVNLSDFSINKKTKQI